MSFELEMPEAEIDAPTLARHIITASTACGQDDGLVIRLQRRTAVRVAREIEGMTRVVASQETAADAFKRALNSISALHCSARRRHTQASIFMIIGLCSLLWSVIFGGSG